GRQQRLPSGNSGRRRVAVGVSLADGRDRPPPVIFELPVPSGSRTVRKAGLNTGEETGAVADVPSTTADAAHRKVAERRLHRSKGDVGEETCGRRLGVAPDQAGACAVVANLLELVDIQVGADCRWRTRVELAEGSDHQGVDLSQPRVEEWHEARRSWPPYAGWRRVRHGVKDRRKTPIVGAQCNDPIPRTLAIPDALILRDAIGNLVKRRRQCG